MTCDILQAEVFYDAYNAPNLFFVGAHDAFPNSRLPSQLERGIIASHFVSSPCSRRLT